MTIEKEGKTYEILADGTILTQGKTIESGVAIHDIPDKILQGCRERNIDTTGKCYYSGYVINREVAEASMAAAAEHRENKKQKLLVAVPGLEELRAAKNADAEYLDAFDHMMDDEYNDGVNPPRKPSVDSAAVARKYPVAAAYLKAESWEYASHHAKVAAGKTAKQRIVAGEDYKIVIDEMESEFGDYCIAHIWD